MSAPWWPLATHRPHHPHQPPDITRGVPGHRRPGIAEIQIRYRGGWYHNIEPRRFPVYAWPGADPECTTQAAHWCWTCPPPTKRSYPSDPAHGQKAHTSDRNILGAARADVHAQRRRCIDIRPGRLSARPWPGLPRCGELLITARRPAAMCGRGQVGWRRFRSGESGRRLHGLSGRRDDA